MIHSAMLGSPYVLLPTLELPAQARAYYDASQFIGEVDSFSHLFTLRSSVGPSCARQVSSRKSSVLSTSDAGAEPYLQADIAGGYTTDRECNVWTAGENNIFFVFRGPSDYQEPLLVSQATRYAAPGSCSLEVRDKRLCVTRAGQIVLQGPEVYSEYPDDGYGGFASVYAVPHLARLQTDDSGVWRLYLDGQLVDRATLGAYAPPAGSRFWIGQVARRPGGRKSDFFQFGMSLNVAGAMSAAEVQAVREYVYAMWLVRPRDGQPGDGSGGGGTGGGSGSGSGSGSARITRARLVYWPLILGASLAVLLSAGD